MIDRPPIVRQATAKWARECASKINAADASLWEVAQEFGRQRDAGKGYRKIAAEVRAAGGKCSDRRAQRILASLMRSASAEEFAEAYAEANHPTPDISVAQAEVLGAAMLAFHLARMFIAEANHPPPEHPLAAEARLHILEGDAAYAMADVLANAQANGANKVVTDAAPGGVTWDEVQTTWEDNCERSGVAKRMVHTFRKYEGTELFADDGRPLLDAVTLENFATHFLVTIPTFRRWCRVFTTTKGTA